MKGSAKLIGPSVAHLGATTLDLPGNGFAYLENDGSFVLVSPKKA